MDKRPATADIHKSGSSEFVQQTNLAYFDKQFKQKRSGATVYIDKKTKSSQEDFPIS